MGPVDAVLARGSLGLIDKLINEITVSVTLEESLCELISDNGDSLLAMDLMRMELFWRDITKQKLKLPALDYLFTKLSNNRNERVIVRILWGLDVLIEKMVFSPKEIAHALVSYDQVRVDLSPFSRCAFKLLLKLIFYLDYKSNREVFNKSIEKSSQFSADCVDGGYIPMHQIDPTVELIYLLLSREMCLMPAYFAMHELIRSFPSGLGSAQHMSIFQSVASFMDSFSKPARLLYSKVHQAIKPFCGITASSSPGFRLDSSSLILTSIKGAMRYPEFLTSPQISLLGHVLGQLRSTELTAGMLESSSGKSKTRSVGLELALVDWIVEVMQLTETADDRHWVRRMFEHLVSAVITFMLSSTVRFNEIVVKLNSKLEGRTWTKSSHHIMWFVLNATSGFIGKNMLTDFVPCLRLYDILFPDAEDPDHVMGFQAVSCGEICEKWGTALSPAGESHTDINMKPNSPQGDTTIGPSKLDSKMDTQSLQSDSDESSDLTDTSAEESDYDGSLDMLPPARHPTPGCRRNHMRLMHLTTAPVCLWQHVLRKSRTGHDHLPRVIPPALRPIEARISYCLRYLLEAIANPGASNTSQTHSSWTSALSWKQLIIILNAYSTDNEASQLIQHVVDLFWCISDSNVDSSSTSDFQKTFWSKLCNKGWVQLPYSLIAHGPLQPLPNHLVRTMSVHLRMLILHLFLQKLNTLPFTEQISSPGVFETMCRILACREVEPSNVGRILGILPKLRPSWSKPNPKPPESLSESSDGPPGTPTCYLLSILLDILGHRLVDTFIPEVRTQTAMTLVGLLRLWPIWTQGDTFVEGEQPVSDGRTTKLSLPQIPLELFYMLEWAISKSVRSLQAPDSVTYGLCAVLSPPSLTHGQVPVASANFSNPLFPNIPGIAALFAGSRGGTASVPRPTGPSTLGNSTELSVQSGAVAVGEAVTPTGCSSSLTNYSFLMSEYAELTRFTLFALLQIYYAFDLEEVSSMKAFLVEQFRMLFERCGLSSLSDLPALISGRLPDFLVHVLRQRSSPPTIPSCAAPRAPFVTDGPDGKPALSPLLRQVTQEFDRLLDGTVTWLEVTGMKNVLLCLMFRHLATRGTIPKAAILTLLHMSFPDVNACLRTFCDYLLACLSSTSGEDTLTVNDLLVTLCSFCLRWRVVPLDRLLMFLLTHTNYQGAQLNALNLLLIHIFAHCDQMTNAISYLSSQFPVQANCPTESVRAARRDLRLVHPDPISSKYWFDCIKHLHELIPDQPVTDQSGEDLDVGFDESEAKRLDLKLPVFYGHLLLRLLPMLEAIMVHFIETELPLMQLIPFCCAVSPLFRFHRRPVNVCYVLLREHWHFVPMEPDAFWCRDSSPNDGRRRWLIDRIRIQLIVHAILAEHHSLALTVAAQRSWKKRATGRAIAGLFTAAAWSEIHSTHITCVQLYESLRESKTIGTEPANLIAAELELQSKLCLWFRSHEKWVNPNYVFSLLEPIRLSTLNHGLIGHPAAWRPWNLEESVSSQAAGLYAASVELMSSFALPVEFVNALSDFICSRAEDPLVDEYLNIIGALVSILPSSYRLAICRFAATLIDDLTLTDPTTEDLCLQPQASCPPGPPATWGSASDRTKRHARQHNLHVDHESMEASGNATRALPPRASVRFFDDLLPPSEPRVRSVKENQNVFVLLKASLWHAIWSHANATQINALPSLFADLIAPRLQTEAQLLMAFHLVAPLMGSLHAERPAKLIDLTAELYRALHQVDRHLAKSQPDEPKTAPVLDESGLYPPDTGIPLVHVDTLADLLYHVKYMYVGNGVSDHVRPLLPRLRPPLRKRLKFILPPPPPSTESLQQEQQTIKQANPDVAGYEVGVYKSCVRPPIGDEDF